MKKKKSQLKSLLVLMLGSLLFASTIMGQELAVREDDTKSYPKNLILYSDFQNGQIPAYPDWGKDVKLSQPIDTVIENGSLIVSPKQDVPEGRFSFGNGASTIEFDFNIKDVSFDTYKLDINIVHSSLQQTSDSEILSAITCRQYSDNTNDTCSIQFDVFTWDRENDVFTHLYGKNIGTISYGSTYKALFEWKNNTISFYLDGKRLDQYILNFENLTPLETPYNIPGYFVADRDGNRIGNASFNLKLDNIYTNIDYNNLNKQSNYVLTDAQPDLHITAGSKTNTIYGTTGANHITLESGAKAELLNFPGSNTITIQSDSSLFTVSRSGAYLTLEGTDGTFLKIPATTTSQTINFNDSTKSLLINSGRVMFGGQEIKIGSAVIGTAQLGLMSGATVKLFSLSDMKNAIATTTSSSNSANYGEFQFDQVELLDDKFYVIEVTGGIDTDPGDDGEVNQEDFINSTGSFYALATGEQLWSNMVRVTALSDLVFTYLQTYIVNKDEDSLHQSRDKLAKRLINDINEDGSVSDLDILLFNPLSHVPQLNINYSELLNIHVTNIHNSAQESIKTSDMLTIIPPSIEILKGKFNKIPFTPEFLVSDLPPGITIQYLLDDQEFDPTSPPIIDTEGQKNITINLYSKGEIVKTYYEFIHGYQTTKLAEVEVTPEQAVEIYLYADEVPENVAGTQLIIPSGALQSTETISVSMNSQALIPGSSGETLSSVITLEPAGTIFSEPVTVLLPANLENVDPDTIRIARTDINGEIDYLLPTKLDSENGFVYFETDHFCDYAVVSDYSESVEDILKKGLFGDPILDETIEDINQRFPGEFDTLTDDDWCELLSMIITHDKNNGVAVYDVYQSVKTGEAIVDAIKEDGSSNNSNSLGGAIQGYVNAFKLLYGEKSMPESGSLKVWKSAAEFMKDPTKAAIKKVFNPEIVDGYYSLKGFADDTKLMTAPDQVNLIKKLGGKYIEGVLDTATAVLTEMDDIKNNIQIRYYFNLRNEGNSYEKLSNALKNTKNSTDFDSWTIKEGVIDANSYTPEDPLGSEFWDMVEGLYIEYNNSLAVNSDKLNDFINAALTILDNKENPYITLEDAKLYTASRKPQNYYSSWPSYPKVCENQALEIRAQFTPYGFAFDAAKLSTKNFSAMATVDGSNGKGVYGECTITDEGLLSCIFNFKTLLDSDETVQTLRTIKRIIMSINYVFENTIVIKNDSFKAEVINPLTINSQVEISSPGYFSYSDYKLPLNISYTDAQTQKQLFTDLALNVSLLINGIKKFDIEPEYPPNGYSNFVISIPEENLFDPGLEAAELRIVSADSDVCSQLNDNALIINIAEQIKAAQTDSAATYGLRYWYEEYSFWHLEGIVKTGKEVLLSFTLDSDLFASLGFTTNQQCLDALKYDLDGDQKYQKTQGSSYITEDDVTRIVTKYTYEQAGDFYPSIKVSNSSGEELIYSGVQITVLTDEMMEEPENNMRPIAIAGEDISTLENNFTLNGEDISDPDGEIFSYQWTLNGDIVGTSPSLTIVQQTPGEYIYGLTVKDLEGLSSDIDWVTVTVGSDPEPSGILTLSTSSLSFGSVDVGNNKTMSLTLTNTGNAPFEMVSITGFSGTTSVFSCDKTLPTSFFLDSGYSWSGNITYTPVAEGEQNISFTITADGETQQVTATGSGVVNGLGARSSVSSTQVLADQELFLTIDVYSGNPDYFLIVDWGDGTGGIEESIGAEASFSHTYMSAGTYQIETIVEDTAGERVVRTHNIVVADTPVMETSWTAEACDIIDNEEITGLSIIVTEKTGDYTYQEYTTNWSPSNEGNDFFVKYHLPVPAGVIDLSNKLRMTAVVRASTFASYDRELGFSTDIAEYITAYVYNQPGYFVAKEHATGDKERFEISAFQDNIGSGSISSHALEIENGTLTAYSYSDDTYTELYSYPSNNSSELNDIQLTFKGNGAILLVKLEYDKDGNGDYDDGYLVLNTQNKQVDWSLWYDQEQPTPSGDCGAYVAPGVWMEFDCYNLAAIGKSTGDDPFTPSWRLIGGYWQWGRKGPDESEWYDTNTANFAHGPTGPDEADANDGCISGWDGSYAPDGAWSDSVKTANDPCPSGYRVPTESQWDGVDENNTQYTVGTWSDSATNYNSGRFFGDDLMLPGAGVRASYTSGLLGRGYRGYYWSSTECPYYSSGAYELSFSNYGNGAGVSHGHGRLSGRSVRCVIIP